MTTSEYEHDGDALLKRRRLEPLGVVLAFVADDIREERTGVHARLRIMANDKVLVYSSFNVDRDEDRVRLANSAHKQLAAGQGEAAFKNTYPPAYLKNDLDQFCYGLWEAKLQEYAPQMLGGTLIRTPPDFILEPYIVSGGGTIVFAPPGRGKSYALMLMQVCVDAGLDRFWPIRQAATLFVNLERSSRSVAERLGNVNRLLNLPRTRQMPTINARGRSLLDVAKAAEAHIKTHGTQVVFVDSISRAGGGDLTANESANRIIDTLNRIAPSWVGLAHTPRSDESHLYGSVHFEAGADVVVQLASQQDEEGPLGIGLQIVKSNDVGKRPMWLGALEFDSSGLVLARRARPGEFLDVEGMRKLSMKDAIREHLLDQGPLDAGQIADDLGYDRSNVSRTLANTPSMFARGDKIGRNQRYVVVKRGAS